MEPFHPGHIHANCMSKEQTCMIFFVHSFFRPDLYESWNNGRDVLSVDCSDTILEPQYFIFFNIIKRVSSKEGVLIISFANDLTLVIQLKMSAYRFTQMLEDILYNKFMTVMTYCKQKYCYLFTDINMP